MPIKKRSVIKAFTRAPIAASCAFCFAKFTPFCVLFWALVLDFERQIRLLAPKFMRIYFVVAIYGLLLCVAALAWQIYSSSPREHRSRRFIGRLCPAHKLGFCRRINLFSRCGAIFMGTAVFACFWLRGLLRRSVISAQHVFARPTCA